MGHQPKALMVQLRQRLDQLTLAHDGVDGKSIYLYGEGWNFGEVANNALFVQATQANMAGTGIGTFNDRIRDAVRGGGPFDADPRIQGFGSGQYTDPNGDPVNGSSSDQKAGLLHNMDLIKVGLTGNLKDYTFTDSTGATVTGAQVDYNGQPAGYTSDPQEAINYVDAHDNETLNDALTYKLPVATTMANRVRMQTLSLATTALSQGVSFWQTGSDALRSKSFDGNSYDSGDWFNVLDPSLTINGFGRGLPPSVHRQVALRETAAGQPRAQTHPGRSGQRRNPIPNPPADPADQPAAAPRIGRADPAEVVLPEQRTERNPRRHRHAARRHDRAEHRPVPSRHGDRVQRHPQHRDPTSRSNRRPAVPPRPVPTGRTRSHRQAIPKRPEHRFLHRPSPNRGSLRGTRTIKAQRGRLTAW